MRSERQNFRGDPDKGQTLEEHAPKAARKDAATGRSSRYWTSGAIPLIAPEMLGDIISEISDIAVVVSEDGTILSVLLNPASSDVAGLTKMEGRSFADALTSESAEKFHEGLSTYIESGARPRAMELNHSDRAGKIDFPFRYSLHPIAPEGAILLLGRDLRPVADMQHQLVQAQIALERDYEVQREFDTRFRVLMEASAEPQAFVSLNSGAIVEANAALANLFEVSRDDLAGRSLISLFTAPDQPGLLERLASRTASDGPVTATIEVSGQGMQVILSPTPFRASGERMLLLRVQPEVQHQGRADAISKKLTALFDTGSDGIVFAAKSGAIITTNDAFLDLIDAAHDLQVRGQNLGDFFQRGSVDLKVMVENTTRSRRMRQYATKLAGEFSTPRSVDIAVTAIDHQGEEIFAFVIRETSRIEALRPTVAPNAEENLQSVIDLVGSATLKDIVAETTNVVEQMCIETAVDLTMNNRVAAAEMLGLSRQSLYVKLRKYGLIEREGD